MQIADRQSAGDLDAIMDRHQQAASQRLAPFDAARGAAMLLVCLSHFSLVYFHGASSDSARQALPAEIAMIASPTFVGISGMLIGLMSIVQREGFATLRIKLIDRAIFVLTVGHVLLAAGRVFETGLTHVATSTVITDVVGVCLLISVWVTPAVRPGLRVLLGVIIFAAAWMLLFLWHPISIWGMAAKELLVGDRHRTVVWYSFPLLQWLGVYTICTAIGQRLGGFYARNDRSGVERTLAVISATSIAASLVLRAASWPFRTAATHGAPLDSWQYEIFFSPWSKQTVSPVYVLFFGGLGVGLIWLVVRASHQNLGRQVLGTVSRIGRSSLAIYILQEYVYFTILWSLDLRQTWAWPLVFALTLLPIYAFAREWDRRRLNRVLTVGLVEFLNKRKNKGEAGAGEIEVRSA
jgi:uncharacterized membrane protein